MTRDEIMAIMARRVDALERRDIEALTELHAPDGVIESPLAGGMARGHDAIANVYRTFFDAFPTALVEREELLVAGRSFSASLDQTPAG